MKSRNDSLTLSGMSKTWGEAMANRVGEMIRTRREADDKSGQWLSDRTAELGNRVSRSTISELETGRRKSITIEDLIVLAAALRIAPLILLYPDGGDCDEIEYLPGQIVERVTATRRFTGISQEIIDNYEKAVSELLEASRELRDHAKEAARVGDSMRQVTADLRGITARGPDGDSNFPTAFEELLDKKDGDDAR
jgi:hypothetical protein